VDGSNFTTRSVEVLNAAHTLAVTAGNPQIEPAHLAAALLRQEQGITANLLTKAGVDAAAVGTQVDQMLTGLPSASGSSMQNPTTARRITKALAKAQELMGEMGDEYVATEHLLLALAIVDTPVRSTLERAGATESALREAITAMRGDRRVT